MTKPLTRIWHIWSACVCGASDRDLHDDGGGGGGGGRDFCGGDGGHVCVCHETC